MEHWLNDTETEKWKYSSKTWPSDTLFVTDFAWIDFVLGAGENLSTAQHEMGWTCSIYEGYDNIHKICGQKTSRLGIHRRRDR